MTEEEIKAICKEYKIKNYKINSDMSVDVNEDVFLTDDNNKLTKIPLKFGKVSGDFYCYNNNLTSLEGCPHYVGKSFKAHNNKLTTLEHCPKYVGHNFHLFVNPITTLDHLSVNFHIGNNVEIAELQISEAKNFGKLFFGHVGYRIYTGFMHVNIFLNENKNPPKKDLPRLLSELRKIQL